MRKLTALVCLFFAAVCLAQAPKSVVGTVASVTADSLQVKTDTGHEATETIPAEAKILRMAPGQKSLAEAAPIKLSDVQAGDRVLLRFRNADAGQPVISAVIVMSKAELAGKQQQEMQQWRAGVGGIVHSVNAADGSIVIKVSPTQQTTVMTSPNTRFLRYAPDSIQFNDARASALDDVKPGDQLRAKGSREGADKFTADTVISGAFKNVAGTIESLDTAGQNVTIKDILSKRTVTVHITPQSQLKELPAQFARGIAFMLKSADQMPAAAANAQRAGAGGEGRRAPEFQQIVSRLPAIGFKDLQKGEALMLVATPGNGSTGMNAITLLTGVEPILTASPTGTASLLSSWNISAGGGDSEQ